MTPPRSQTGQQPSTPSEGNPTPRMPLGIIALILLVAGVMMYRSWSNQPAANAALSVAMQLQIRAMSAADLQVVASGGLREVKRLLEELDEKDLEEIQRWAKGLQRTRREDRLQDNLRAVQEACASSNGRCNAAGRLLQSTILEQIQGLRNEQICQIIWQAESDFRDCPCTEVQNVIKTLKERYGCR